jgi:hypothetical protein
MLSPEGLTGELDFFASALVLRYIIYFQRTAGRITSHSADSRFMITVTGIRSGLPLFQDESFPSVDLLLQFCPPLA